MNKRLRRLCIWASAFTGSVSALGAVPSLDIVRAKWTVRTDKTERPSVGKSEARYAKNKNEVRFQGNLALLKGTFGPVGFAQISTAIPFFVGEAKSVSFLARSKSPGTSRSFALLLKDDQAEQSEGTLTFQSEFRVDSTPTRVDLPTNGFAARIRGKKEPNFRLDLESVEELAFQIARSEQPADLLSVDPLPFDLEILSAIEFR